MASTGGESSIGSSSIFIPSWVKNKFDNSDFDPSTLSPPTHDGEFLHLKFPRQDKSKLKTENTFKDRALDNHTPSCKKFIPIVQESVLLAQTKMTKPMGVDDRFKEEGVTCGASVVAVAQQMISGKKSPIRGFTTDDANIEPPAGYLGRRRNSKSLPTTPIISPESSPRTRRKNVTTFALQNRFNPGAIEAVSEAEETVDKKSSWLLSGFFSNSKGELVNKDHNILAAEDSGPTTTDSNIKANLNLTVEVKAAELSSAPIPDRTTYQKKRRELRELNFISPVSM